jgi:HD-like signal output (HDOD) protein/CheY-like chemotaxis protein
VRPLTDPGLERTVARILVILETSSFRQPLAESLRGAGYETDISENCRRGMAKAVAAPPNVIVLDPAMEGKNGWDVIRRCRLDPSLSGVRIILVTTVADRKTVLLAAQFGIRDFLIKSREISRELIERLRRYYPPGAAVTGLSPAACPAPAASPAPPEKGTVPLPATGQIPSLLTREQCLARVEKASANRPISGVAGQVMNLASSPLAEMSELAELIGKDPVFATRILRAANSAAFSGRRKGVTTIADAVRNIGISTIADIATALTVFEAVPCGDSGNFNYIRSWQHSFATAMICQQLAKLVNPPDAGAAYLVGLCHDMGQIVFRSEFNSEYDQVLKFAAETGLDLETAERQMLGVVQLDLARLILRKLGLPDAIRQPIEEFQSLQRQPGRRPALPLARLLRWRRSLCQRHAAGRVAHLAGRPVHKGRVSRRRRWR